jgi:hypothetical protein
VPSGVLSCAQISTPLGLMSAAKAKLAKQGGLALAKVYIV